MTYERQLAGTHIVLVSTRELTHLPLHPFLLFLSPLFRPSLSPTGRIRCPGFGVILIRDLTTTASVVGSVARVLWVTTSLI